MILFLQLLAVLVPAALAVVFALLVVAPALGGIIHGRGFTILWWHGILAGIFAALAVALAVAFGWIGAP